MRRFKIDTFKAWLGDAPCVVIKYDNKRIIVSPQKVIDTLRDIFDELRGVFIEPGRKPNELILKRRDLYTRKMKKVIVRRRCQRSLRNYIIYSPN